MMMIVVVPITTVDPPARARSASILADASSRAATRAETASGLIPSLPAAATALLDESAAVTTARSFEGRAATAAFRSAELTVLRCWAANGGLREIAASATSSNNYSSAPIFYISDGGPSNDPNVPGEVYQIDAAGFGGNGNTVAVVESTYAVYSSSNNRGGL